MLHDVRKVGQSVHKYVNKINTPDITNILDCVLFKAGILTILVQSLTINMSNE